MAEALGGRPLTVRTLDAGADKPLAALPLPAEANPFLGVRGIRLSLRQPAVFATQLRAVLRVAADHPLRVMFPMVATVDELLRGREALDAARASLAAAGVTTGERVEVGIMVEVPSAALIAETLAPHVDFFSLGTNDLAQYVLAADRGNAELTALGDALHPAVLMLIERTVRAGRAAGRWVGVCGELAGDPAAVPVLLGLGVRELSMAPSRVPAVKQVVRATASDGARDLALAALERPRPARCAGSSRSRRAPERPAGRTARTRRRPRGRWAGRRVAGTVTVRCRPSRSELASSSAWCWRARVGARTR